MDKKLKDLTGAVDVNGDVTPTLREKINKVSADDWHKMSTSDLWEQKITLITRLSYAQQLGHPEMIKQIQRGIATIEQILDSKNSEEARLL